MAEASRNLMVARGQTTSGTARTHTTPYDQERWIAAAWGSALTMVGARRGGFGGGLLATLGAVIAVRAAMGRHDFAMARHWTNDTLRSRGWRAKDIVHDDVGRIVPRERLAVVDAHGRNRATARMEDDTDMNMELTFPDDAREARARSDRNLSEVERWASIAAGAGLTVYGLSRAEAQRLAPRRARRAAAAARRHRALRRLRSARAQYGRRSGRHARGAARLARRQRARKRHDQPPDRGALPLLAQPREPAAVHAASRVGREGHRHDLALARQGAGRHGRRVGRRDPQRGPQPGDRLALARRGGRRQRRLGQLRPRRRRTRHARDRAPAVQPAGRQGRRGRRQAVRPRRRNRDPRRSAPLQAVEADEVPAT